MLIINETTKDTTSNTEIAMGAIQVQVFGLQSASVALEISQDSLPMGHTDTIRDDKVIHYQLASGSSYRFRVIGVEPGETVSVSVLNI